MKHLFILSSVLFVFFACKNEAGNTNAVSQPASSTGSEAATTPAAPVFDAAEAAKVFAEGKAALSNSQTILNKAAGLSKEKYAREIESIGSKVSTMNDRGFVAVEELQKGLDKLKAGEQLSAEETAKLVVDVQILKSIVEGQSFINKRIDEMMK